MKKRKLRAAGGSFTDLKKECDLLHAHGAHPNIVRLHEVYETREEARPSALPSGQAAWWCHRAGQPLSSRVARCNVAWRACGGLLPRAPRPNGARAYMGVTRASC